MNDVATMDVELIDLGFGKLVRSSNEEFRTVEYEVVWVTPEQNVEMELNDELDLVTSPCGVFCHR